MMKCKFYSKYIKGRGTNACCNEKVGLLKCPFVEDGFKICKYFKKEIENEDDISATYEPIRRKRETEEGRLWDIYQEGYITDGMSGEAYYIGSAYGKTFLDACKNFIKKTGFGEIKIDLKGEEYASYWGCVWFPTLAKAQESFG